MKKELFLLVVTLPLFVSGCAMMVPERDRLNMASRYSELERHMEKETQGVSTVTSEQLWYICHAQWRLKKYDKLAATLERLEQNIQRGDCKWYGFDFSAMPSVVRADVNIDFGNYPKAVEEATKAYQLATTGKADKYVEIQTLSELLLALALNDNRDQALHYADLLEKVSVAYPHNILAPDKYKGLTRGYMALGLYDKALAASRQATYGAFGAFADAMTVVAGVNVSGESIFTFNELPLAYTRSKCEFEAGDMASAKAGYDKILANIHIKDNGDIHRLVLADRGQIAEREGNVVQAIEFYQQAIEVIEQQRSSINTEASKIGFVGDKQAVYYRLIAALLATKQPAAAFDYVERAKSRALVDLLASRQQFGAPPSRVFAANDAVKKLDAAEAEARVQDTAATADQMSKSRGVVVEARQQLQQTAPELSSLVTVTAPGAKEIQSLIPQGETLLEYYGSGNDLFAFVVTRDGLTAVKLDGAGLVDDISQLRAALKDPGSDKAKAVTQRLNQRLMQPVEKQLAGRALIIVPHGALHYVPFNALSSGADCLIDRYSIRVLPSASVMKFLKARQERKLQEMLVLGNPNLGDPKYDLKFAEQEAVTISKLVPHAKLLVRSEATETAFLSLAERADAIHFACHGRFDPDAPLNSSLLLAKDSQNDGMLFTSELYSLRLNAGLLCLSACETGLGKVSNGDDVVGLTRGFLYAGCSSIVSSLWTVDDEATGFLMTKFYTFLRENNPRDALRLAQLATKKQFAHPYYWAAFQLTGRAD